MPEILKVFNATISDRGIKIIYVSDQTKIEYQRLVRILNGHLKMSVTEFLRLCKFFELNPKMFIPDDLTNDNQTA